MDSFFEQAIVISFAFFLVFLNGFFVNAEFAIVKVRRTRIQGLVKDGHRRAKVADEMISNMDEYLSATQLGITLASLGLGWIGEPAFARLFEPLLERLGVTTPALVHTLAVGSAFILITFLHIVLGELAPKSLAIQKPEPSILWTGVPLAWFYRISYPFIWALNGTARFFLKMAGLEPSSEAELAHSEAEFRLLLAESHDSGVLDHDKKKMLERVFEFAERSVRQVMVPTVDVKFLNLEDSLEENLTVARKARHTRFPLCEGSLDRVVGIVNMKDLIWIYEELGPKFDLGSIKRSVQFVPENKGLRSLLADFRKSRIHLAIVVDEHGSTVGIVTLEDVLEELVGEIQDEFDIGTPPEMIREISTGHYRVHGRTLITQIESELDLQLHDEENDTVAGHVLMELGRTANAGDEVTVGGLYRVRVIGMRGFQITDLVFDRLDPEPQTNPED